MQIGIIGTGLIGASIGLRLHSHGEKGISVIGYDVNRENLNLAQKINAIDSIAESIDVVVKNAKIIIISAPILDVKAIFESINESILQNNVEDLVVTDTSSSKSKIIEWANTILPKNVFFVGSHPMAGSTEVGPNYSDGSIFEGARWVITPTENSPQHAIETILSLIEAMGADPMFMDADEHDSYVAGISHMPLFAQIALFALARESNAWAELSMLASSGFKSASRLVATNPSLAFDINETNRMNIEHWIERYIEELQKIKLLLQDSEDKEEFFRFIGAMHLDYLKFLDGAVGREHWGEQLTNVPDYNAFDLLMGGMLTDKLNKLDFDTKK
ncbi:MAG: prephenate dehydrogenase [Chloroflexi bacterium]|nr:prephenate dehydrogenase [Chloroflexota bacterium]|tara:strand:- start:17212 stop:18204 length:993 start_codon:yes stop_codon:yes gene_type:complete